MAIAAKNLSPRDLCLVYSEADPRVSSIRIAERLHPNLHTSRNSKITGFVDRNRAELERYGDIPRRGVNPGRGSTGGRPAVEDLLNEDQVTIVCMRSDSKEAADARFEIVQLIRAYRRGEIPKTAITIIADLFDPRPATVTPLAGNVTQVAFAPAPEPEKTADERFLDCIAEGPNPTRQRRSGFNPSADLNEVLDAENQRLAQSYGLPSARQEWQIEHHTGKYEAAIICEQGPPFVVIKPANPKYDTGARTHSYVPTPRWIMPQVLLRMEPDVPTAVAIKVFASERFGPHDPVTDHTIRGLFD